MRDLLKIFKVQAPYEFVVFDHNPEQLRMRRQVKGAAWTEPVRDTSAQPRNRGVNPTKVTISKARLVGPETKLFCDKLLEWTLPDTTAVAAQALGLGTDLPLLLAQWGPPGAGFTFQCILSRADITFQRVSSAGTPTHALVTLVLDEKPLPLPGTNPTSGGRPGRDRHVVSADETLASIAMRAFGQPEAWRAVAEVNGIDDPRTIAPGDVIFLPGRAELAELVR